MTGVLSPGQMTRSQEEFNFHLAQALSCLHSRRQHIKTWAAVFIGMGNPTPTPPPDQKPCSHTPLRRQLELDLHWQGEGGDGGGGGPVPMSLTGQKWPAQPSLCPRRLHHLLPPPGRAPDGERGGHEPAVL